MRCLPSLNRLPIVDPDCADPLLRGGVADPGDRRSLGASCGDRQDAAPPRPEGVAPVAFGQEAPGGRVGRSGGRMSATGKNRSTWLCLVAQRWDVVGVPFPEGAAGQEREGLIVRGLRRHVERCPYCQHQVAEWQQVVTWLQSARKVQAPGDLVDRVMGKIPLERAGAAAACPVPNGERADHSRRGAGLVAIGSSGFLKLHRGLWALGRLATPHAIVASTLPQAIGGLADRAITASSSSARRGGGLCGKPGTPLRRRPRLCRPDCSRILPRCFGGRQGSRSPFGRRGLRPAGQLVRRDG